MREHRNNDAGGECHVRRSELDAAIRQSAVAPAQGGSASAAPLPGLIIENESTNRYTVQLAEIVSPGQPPEPIDGEQVSAINLAEPFDQAGDLEADTPVLIWPGQGLYLFSCPVPADPPAAQDDSSWWARVVSGQGPGYTVRRQIAGGAGSFANAPGSEDADAANTWELSVDGEASADVPAGAIVRVFEAPDSGDVPRRFFFYPIHAVYR